MKIFISGGCKNGKSWYAQHLAQASFARPLYYIATMKPADKEDDERILRHQQEREGIGFITVEQPVNIAEILRFCDKKGSFLLDSLTALLANEMFDSAGMVKHDAPQKLQQELSCILHEVRNIVIVSDYIYSDAIVYDELTENYRRGLAMLDRTAARLCDTVLEVSFTGVFVHRGEDGVVIDN